MPRKRKAVEKSKKLKSKKLGLAKFIPSKKKKSTNTEDKTKTRDTERTDAIEEAEHKGRHKICDNRSNTEHISLVERCKQRMSSSLLRLVDEELYNTESRFVALDKDRFLEYHKAYADVSEKWPTKPIDYIVKFIKRRLLPKRPLHKLKFADIGCGQEPLLKMQLPPKANVRSFDLVSLHSDIEEANMERLPLNNSSIHCAVYSLSLMATNLGGVLLEAKRVLKNGGSLLIVEVTSRFERREKRFATKLERIGFKQKSKTPLKPNDYFTFFHFTKVDERLDYPNSSLLIELKPCSYRAR